VITAADLRPERDPQELVAILGRLGKRPTAELKAAVQLLIQHGEPDVRSESLRVGLVQWKEREYRGAAMAALFRDPDADVRCTAAFGIAAVSSTESRREDQRVLLSIVFDGEEDDIVRLSAYDALLLIHKRPSFPPANRDPSLAVDLDWQWLNALKAQDG
jgi:hypothetical protein